MSPLAPDARSSRYFLGRSGRGWPGIPRTIALLWLTSLLGLACQTRESANLTDPRLPPVVAPNSQLGQVTYVLDVDVQKRSVTITPPTLDAAGINLSVLGPEFSILAGDVVELTASNFAASEVGQFTPGRVRVTFDLSIFNRLAGAQLVTSTFPAPGSGAQGIMAFPFAQVVTTTAGGTSSGGDGTEVIIELPNHGQVTPSLDWNREPISFFNDDPCNADANDCFRSELYRQPLLPGAVSEANTVGYDVDATVGQFRSRIIVAADLADPVPFTVRNVWSPNPASPNLLVNLAIRLDLTSAPTQAYAWMGGVVTVDPDVLLFRRAVVGDVPGNPLAVVHDGDIQWLAQNLSANAGITGEVTVMNLEFQVVGDAGESVGTRSVVDVLEVFDDGQRAVIAIDSIGIAEAMMRIQTVPSGTITGTVTSSFDGLPLAGVNISITPTGGSPVVPMQTNASGVYTITDVPVLAGGGDVTLTLPPFCSSDSGTRSYGGLMAGQTLTVNVVTDCDEPPPPPDQPIISLTWSVNGGTASATITAILPENEDVSAAQWSLELDLNSLSFVSAANGPNPPNFLQNCLAAPSPLAPELTNGQNFNSLPGLPPAMGTQILCILNFAMTGSSGTVITPTLTMVALANLAGSNLLSETIVTVESLTLP